MAHDFNPSTQEANAGLFGLEARLSQPETQPQKQLTNESNDNQAIKKMLDMVAQAHNPCIGDAEMGRSELEVSLRPRLKTNKLLFYFWFDYSHPVNTELE